MVKGSLTPALAGLGISGLSAAAGIAALGSTSPAFVI
jgi:hypothetical protein